MVARYQNSVFELIVLGDPAVGDRVDDNVDVEVRLKDGRRFSATFFTLRNLETLFAKNKDTGECAGGLYLWAEDMLLVREISIEALSACVNDLRANGEFYRAFGELEP